MATLAAGLDWGSEFKAFTPYHATMLGLCLLAIVAACVIGLRLRGSAREKRFRVMWGWVVLFYKIAETVHDCWPGRFDLKDSLPLQVCDLAAFLAAGAMITQRRTLRALLYFWGLGLSPQAVLMPTLTAGYRSLDFWFFWGSHTMVIGSAVYDLIVMRFRPSFRDLAIAAGWILAYALIVTGVNLGFQVNYGFIGNTNSGNPPAIERLGPWPLRAIKVCSAVGGLFVVMWAVWAVGRRVGLVRKSASGAARAPVP